MATIYTSDDVLAVRRYQAVCCVNQYIRHVCKKDKYGGATTCMKNKMVLLTQWVDILLRYDNPANSSQEALNCLTEAQIDHILEQISKATGCEFFAKSTSWKARPVVTGSNIPFVWNDGDDIQWNDTDTIDQNETE